MRLLSLIVRPLVRAGAILLALLLAASTAEAAHHASGRRSLGEGGRHASAARRAACAAEKTTLKQFRRTPHNFGGPLAKPSQRVLVGLADPTTRIANATETDEDDGTAAIQNDAPVTGAELDNERVPMLQPIGLLFRVSTAHPRSHECSPKPPRGPPQAL